MAKTPIPQKQRKRPTQAEHQERIELTYKLLARRKRKSDIIAAVAKRYNVAPKTVRNNYLVSARQMMLAEVREERETQRSKALATYEAILSDESTSAVAKIKAQERIDKLLGLEAPQKVAQTDEQGRGLFQFRPPEEDDQEYIEWQRQKALSEQRTNVETNGHRRNGEDLEA